MGLVEEHVEGREIAYRVHLGERTIDDPNSEVGVRYGIALRDFARASYEVEQYFDMDMNLIDANQLPMDAFVQDHVGADPSKGVLLFSATF